jgi:hypothetical protein
VYDDEELRMIFQRTPDGGFRECPHSGVPREPPRPKKKPGPVLRLVDRVVTPAVRAVYERTQFMGVWLTLTLTERSYVLHGMLGPRGKTHNMYIGRLADGTFLAGVD